MEHLEQVDIDQQAKEYGYETAQPKNVIEKTTFGINAIVEAVESGVINPLDAFASFNKLEKLFKEAKVKIDELARDEAEKYTSKTFTFGNVEFTRKEGAKKLNYSEDLVYSEIQSKLKAREELLKVAQKQTMLFDNEGIEVPKVSISHNKDSLIVKFK
jgi:2C-methyl-D-erythritol 2,4-cyclodiphosphate synthase